ncbi:hypothetical protein HWD35_07550 [Tsukamurella tyrosinosolvens]|uniref:hypothetical protein n=1 Tax=Tsukamurella tyrosinosolvens TaxID=57704 RepID=UPI0007950929|nr:hypothetical protein [Tsukamurella tyrosinosolvens]KXP07181.1 hypothetical protein AXK59_03590 [Tsukamurella tyrosinosolvens]KZL98382.1 hypothetical protein AXX05_05740 [Tsukamurella tyrosinosolvens]MCA4994562.1 hypothetical protein [Tsukamurella tyrosinosolvens]WEL92568.1 hypothetical protein P1N98_15535 [Tsukamurella tyrosinosolvens]
MRPELRSVPGAAPKGVVFGDPHVTPDGTTVITVSRVRRRRSGEDRVSAIGVYTVREGRTTWTPAVDADRIALLGVTTGLIAATLASLAVLRQPPWPVMTGAITVHRDR